MADNSDGGKLITHAEYDVIHTFPLPVNVTWATANKLIMRFNNTFYNWDHGILKGDNMVDYIKFNQLTKQLESNIKTAKKVGANSLPFYFTNSTIFSK